MNFEISNDICICMRISGILRENHDFLTNCIKNQKKKKPPFHKIHAYINRSIANEIIKELRIDMNSDEFSILKKHMEKDEHTKACEYLWQFRNEKENNSVNEECSICWKELNLNESKIKLRCKHCLCKQCLINMIDKDLKTCPMCRASIY
jgi:hypothetical protein